MKTFVLCALVAFAAALAAAQENTPSPQAMPVSQMINNVIHTSDAVYDFSSSQALFKQVVKPDMTDPQKSEAVWRAVYESRFWRPASRGLAPARFGAVDPIRYVNSYAATICMHDVSILANLWEQLGLDARMYQVVGHTTSEVYYDGAWRHYDATMGQITKDEKGVVQSVVDSAKYGGRAWVKPESYVSHNNCALAGHTMAMTLRQGEQFTRYWGPLGKAECYWEPTSSGKRPFDDIQKRRRAANEVFTETQPAQTGPRYMERTMKLRPRQFEMPPLDACYGNGQWLFEPDLASADWEKLAHAAENVQQVKSDAGIALRPNFPDKPACVIYRLQSPYIMTGGSIVVKGTGLKVSMSVDNGGSWTELPGMSDDIGLTQYLTETVLKGFLEALVKVEISDKGQLTGLKFETFVMNNPFVLPALKLGKTTVKLSAGEQLERITLLPEFDNGKYRKQIVSEKNTQTAREGKHEGWVKGVCAIDEKAESELVFKVAAPGDIRRLRVGGLVDANNDKVKFFYSTDAKTWKEMPWTWTQNNKVSKNEKRSTAPNLETVEKFPAGTREVFVRYWWAAKAPIQEQCNLWMIGAARIDVDYVPATAGKLPPVEVVYNWTENHGEKKVEKTHKQVVRDWPASYEITVEGDKEPTMKSVSMRLAQ